MKQISKFILDIFFPNRCPFCDHFIRWDKLACDTCIDAISFTAEEICTKCGKSPCICNQKLYYDRCYTACYYEGIVRDGIIRLKSQNGLNAAELFADVLSKKITGDKLKIDWIVPVPMSRKKKIQRGYNQAEELAKYISKQIRVPVSATILNKFDEPIEQHSLNAKERSEHVKTLFTSKTSIHLTGKNILLCDDVITTGSTLNECSKILKKIGANAIYLAVGATTNLNNS